MEQSENRPNPIAGEPASPCSCENFTPRLECLCCGDSLTLVPTESTRDLIELAIRETERLYMNALGIVDSCARGVMKNLATEILTTLRSAESTLPAEVPRVSYHEGAVTISTVQWDNEEGWCDPETGEPLSHAAPSIADELEAADLEGWN